MYESIPDYLVFGEIDIYKTLRIWVSYQNRNLFYSNNYYTLITEH